MTAALPLSSPAHDDAPGASPVVFGSALVAVALPVLLAYNLPPSSTFLNQAAALVGWGLFCAMLAATLPRQATAAASGGLRSLVVALVLLLGAVVVSMFHSGLPSGLGLSSLGLIGAAILVACTAAAVQQAGEGDTAFEVFCLALLAAALASVAIAIVQYFFPALADGDVLARASSPGRVGANLRQPNHLSSLLLAALAGLVWLHDRRERRATPPSPALRAATVAVALLLVFGVVLTVSRTGTVCIVMLALWGVVDRRLSRFTRAMLWLVPLVYVLCWMGVSEWSAAQAHAFAGESQLHKSDLSSSRFGIWSNTLALIRMHPWTGVGWGEFNFAWTLTPFPGRPVAFFDHTHNLPLQFAVELGLPLATLVLVLLAAALWGALQCARRAVPADLPSVRCGLAMVLMMAVHSLLEYPLWYAYFLLPTAFAFGIAVGGRRDADARPARAGRVLVAGGVLLAVGGLFSFADYLRVVQIFAPGSDPAPLEQRIESGRHSVFFAHHAHYAAVTTAAYPSTEMPGFEVAPHYLLDARLMVAWAKALNERGDVERARYVAERLKEFNHPEGDKFFAVCADAAAEPLPFQCAPSTKAFTSEDFRGTP
jgi:O-antigen ligase